MSGQYDAYGSYQGRATIVADSNLSHDGVSFRWPKCKGTASDDSYKVGSGFQAPVDTVFSVYRSHGSGQIYNLIADGYGSGSFYGNGPIKVFSLSSLKWLPEILEAAPPVIPVAVTPPTPVLNLNAEPKTGKTYRIPTPPPVPLPMTAATVRAADEKRVTNPPAEKVAGLTETQPTVSSTAGMVTFTPPAFRNGISAYVFRYDLLIQRIMEDPEKWIRAIRGKTSLKNNQVRLRELLNGKTTPHTETVNSVEQAVELRRGYLGSTLEEVPPASWNPEVLDFTISRVCRSLDPRYGPNGNFKGNLRNSTPIDPSDPFAIRFCEILKQSGVSRSGFVRYTGISPSTLYTALGADPTAKVVRTLRRVIDETCEFDPAIFDLSKPLPDSQLPLLKVVRLRNRSKNINIPEAAAPAAEEVRVFKPTTDEQAAANKSASWPWPGNAEPPAPTPAPEPLAPAPAPEPVDSPASRLREQEVFAASKSDVVHITAEKHLSVAVELDVEGRFQFRIRETGKVFLTAPGTSRPPEVNVLRLIVTEALNEGYLTALADIDRRD